MKKLVVLSLLFFSLGAGCLFDGKEEAWDDSSKFVTLTQGRPPVDCGQRNPKKMQPYFTIPTLQKVSTNDETYFVQLGDHIGLDASCTVGRIKELYWDFEFEAWPESTPPERRFEAPVVVKHWDLDYPDYDKGDYDLNNTPYFYETYYPTQPGKLTARLKTVDHKGRTQTVISQYIVRPRNETIVDSVRANFYLVRKGSVYPQGTRANPVYIARFPSQNFFDFGEASYRDISDGDYQYVTDVKSNRFGVGADIIDNYGRATKFDWQSSYKLTSENFIVNSAESQNLLEGVIVGGHNLPSVRGYDIRFFQAHDTSDNFRLSLTTQAPSGGADSLEQSFRSVDLTTLPSIIPQFIILPGTLNSQNEFRFASVLPKYPDGVEVERGQSLLFSNTSLFPLPRVARQVMIEIPGETSKDRGVLREVLVVEFERALLHLKTLWNAEIIVEFDKGDGEFVQVANFKANEINFKTELGKESVVREDNNKYFETIYTLKDYVIDFEPGNYVARMRVKQIRNENGQRIVDEKIVQIPYKVVLPRNSFEPKIVASAERVEAGEQVTFDGVVSKGNLHLYDWVIRNEETGQWVHELKSIEGSVTQLGEVGVGKTIVVEPKIYDFTSYRFRHPGTYKVIMTTYSASDRSPGAAEVLVRVGERQEEYAGSLPDISPEIYPVGVARGGNLVDQSSYANDRIIFSIPTLNDSARKVEWDFESNGTIDSSCDVQVYSGYVSCNQVIKSPPHTALGQVTATVYVSEKSGGGRVMEKKEYYIIEQDRIMKF